VNHLHNETPNLALGGLFELTVVLGDAMERTLSASGLTTARAEVISTLHGRGPMTQRELSDELRCTPRNVTGLVDALEADGFVARGAHPTDRRATLVSLTEQGTTTASGWRAEHENLATALFGDLAADDFACFAGGLRHVLDRLRDATGTSEPVATS
jgi:DNA-binding MarR family transcriptional regulator